MGNDAALELVEDNLQHEQEMHQADRDDDPYLRLFQHAPFRDRRSKDRCLVHSKNVMDKPWVFPTSRNHEIAIIPHAVNDQYLLSEKPHRRAIRDTPYVVVHAVKLVLPEVTDERLIQLMTKPPCQIDGVRRQGKDSGQPGNSHSPDLIFRFIHAHAIAPSQMPRIRRIHRMQFAQACALNR